MAVLTATGPVDMTDWDFANISNGTITGHTPTKYSITGADGERFYQFTGAGLTYNGSNELTGGVVTGFKIVDADGNTLLSISGFTMAGDDVQDAIDNNNAGGAFENAVFAHENTITGSAFDDVLMGLSDGRETIDGGDGDDIIIDFTSGGSDLIDADSIFGGNGNDTLHAGPEWVGNSFDGGAGYDTMVFSGDYPLLFSLSEAYFAGVEEVVLLGGPNYSFFFADSAIAAGETLRIDASQLSAAARLQIFADDETDGHFEIIASRGDDRLRGGELADTFWLDAAGKDRVHGDGGNDHFIFGSRFNLLDRVIGGDGDDVLRLDGDYASGIAFNSKTIRGVESINLEGGNDYTLVLNDGNVAVGEGLTIVGVKLGAADSLFVDGSDEADGSFVMIDGGGNDTLIGGGGGDTFGLSSGGTNIVQGGAGDDSIVYIGDLLTAAETIDGGDGNDTVQLAGEFNVVFTATTMVNVEEILVNRIGDVSLTLDNANVRGGDALIVDASAMDSALYSLTFNGAAETNGLFVLVGGDGDDSLIGGAQPDELEGGLGADTLIGGNGNDLFIYGATAESTGRGFDTVDGFNANGDFFDLSVVPLARDANVNAGTLNQATFNADLEAAIGAGQLGANNFVLFKPNAGTFDGSTFLIVDQNALAGYQANADLVILMPNLVQAGNLTPADFV